MSGFDSITPAEAVKAFAKRNITIQTATPIKAPGNTLSGASRERDQYEVKYVPLKAEHILAAKRYFDGRVSIVTIDGRRFQEPERSTRHPSLAAEAE